jgi:hypothetical protein
LWRTAWVQVRVCWVSCSHFLVGFLKKENKNGSLKRRYSMVIAIKFRVDVMASVHHIQKTKLIPTFN